MKVHILYEFQEGPWGGGNQFLKGLLSQFKKMSISSSTLDEADAVLINGHHLNQNMNALHAIAQKKAQNPRFLCFHRQDGPLILTRGRDPQIDEVTFLLNRIFVDGSIFQSLWSERNCAQRGLSPSPFSTIIPNAPDSEIFYPQQIRAKRDKTRLICTSWSTNPQKGFDAMQYLDKNLDWSRFSMRFVGKSPVSFRHIEHIPPIDSQALASVLRDSDIFVAAFRNDSCSNSMFEALHCGLPIVVLNSGGNAEIARFGGALFEDLTELIPAIETVAANLEAFRLKIHPPSLAQIASQYYGFMRQVNTEAALGRYTPKRPTKSAEIFFRTYAYFKQKLLPAFYNRVLANNAGLNTPNHTP